MQPLTKFRLFLEGANSSPVALRSTLVTDNSVDGHCGKDFINISN